jgi:hypothetical protein
MAEIMNRRLVLVAVPVSEVDRAKDFYVNTLDYDVKTDVQVSDAHRVVRLTPPGSECSIVFGTSPLGSANAGIGHYSSRRSTRAEDLFNAP